MENIFIEVEEPNLLEVRDLEVNFSTPDGIVEAVKGISFDIKKWETLALVGESGSGKSVTALSILQLLPYPTASHPNGSIKFEEMEMIGARDRDMRKIRGDRISMIFQEPMTSLNPLHNIEKQVGEVLWLHKGMSKNKARGRVLELLSLVGLPKAEKRLKAYPHELSGGERQRVMIAMALANEPDILIADEPTTALDVTIQAQILQLLQKLQQELGMAILLITHDLGVVRKMADHVCVMKDGVLVESRAADELFDSPNDDYTKELLEAEPKGRALAVDKDAIEIMRGDNVKVYFPIKAGLLRRVVDNVKAVDGISLKVKAGQTVGVVGESGSGKTTLGMALLRLNNSSGRIAFMGNDIEDYNQKQIRPLRREMQLVFQDPYGSLSPRLSVGDIIGEGLKVHRLYENKADYEAKICAALEEVGMSSSVRHRYPHEFSGGQRQRISIARTMILKPKFIVLDEPTSALDMSVQAQIVELLRNLQKKHNLAYLFISHDLRVVRALSNEVIVMRRGKMVEGGTVDEIFDAPKEDYTKALMAAALNLEVAHEDVLGV